MDTYGGSIFDPTSLHKYLYANVNPVTYCDPSGYVSLADVAITVAVSSVLMSITGAIMGGILEAVRQKMINPQAKLNWNQIWEAVVTGAKWGAVIGAVAGLAEFFAAASLVMSGFMLFFAGMSFRQAKLDWDEYHNWKLVALDIVLGILSLVGAGKYAAKAKGMYDAKQAAKATETAKTSTDTSPENTNTAGDGKGTSENPATNSQYIPMDDNGNPISLNRTPKNLGGIDMPLPDPNANGAPHSVLGGKISSKTGELYLQEAQFPGGETYPPYQGSTDIPFREIHWTDHGRPWDHTNPHQHVYTFENGQWVRSGQIPYHPPKE